MAAALPAEDFGRAVELILRCVENRGKVVVCGVGKSGHIGDKIAATLTSTGSPAVVLNSLNALHGDLGVVADGDVVLALSMSGETPELLNILPALARLDARLIAITGQPDSTLGRTADVCLPVDVRQEACPLRLAPTSSTTAMLVLGDALAMVLLEARGFSEEDFARYHPAGSLGRAVLTKVAQIMRRGDRVAALPGAATVLEALQAMSRCRAGAVAVTDEAGRLCGVFTQGDFARHYQRDGQVGNRRLAEVMTPHPVTVGSDRLAAEVLHLLKTHPIDDLIVVDDDGRPVGIVDSQDLARLQMV